jgi:hypothetical protein
MIKIRHDACIFSVLFVLNACSSLMTGLEDGAEVAHPTYRVMRVEIEALPSFFHSGTLSFGTQLPLSSSSSFVQDYKEPLLTAVRERENFSLYRGRLEDRLHLPIQEASYLLRSIYRGQDAKGSIPFESLFKCPANVPLCLHVTFSDLYRKEVTNAEKLGGLPPPLTLELREVLRS